MEDQIQAPRVTLNIGVGSTTRRRAPVHGNRKERERIERKKTEEGEEGREGREGGGRASIQSGLCSSWLQVGRLEVVLVGSGEIPREMLAAEGGSLEIRDLSDLGRGWSIYI